MKYLRLIRKNALRNKRRTLLTMLSVAVSVFLVATLRSVLTELSRGAEASNALVLVTRSNVSLVNPMPISYWQQIRKVPGVEEVTPVQWFGGIYIDQQHSFANFAVDAESYLTVFGDDIRLSEEEKIAWFKNRTGCIIGRKLAEKHGWQLGDRVPLYSDIFNLSPDFTIEGIYDGKEERMLIFHWQYMAESRPFGVPEWNVVSTYNLRVESKEDIQPVSQTIDEMFHNSSAETLTESEQSFMLSMVSMWGNIRQFILVIASAVVFTILLVTGNAMAMAIRERRGEIGIMKAVGFKNGTILALLLSESVMVCFLGGLLGTFGASAFGKSLENAPSGAVPIPALHVTDGTIALCLTLAVLVALISTAIPAYQASRLTVAEALRRVG